MQQTVEAGRAPGETPGSEGRFLPQGCRPKEDEPTTSDHAEGRPPWHWGKPSMVYGVAVCEVGMHSLGRCGDIGKPSVLRTVRMREAQGSGPRWQMAQGTGAVGLVATRGRRGQGGGGGRTSEDAEGNLGGAKGPWSTKDHAEEAGKMTSRGWERNGGATHPVLYEEPPREGEGVKRPLVGQAWSGNNP